MSRASGLFVLLFCSMFSVTGVGSGLFGNKKKQDEGKIVLNITNTNDTSQRHDHSRRYDDHRSVDDHRRIDDHHRANSHRRAEVRSDHRSEYRDYHEGPYGANRFRSGDGRRVSSRDGRRVPSRERGRTRHLPDRGVVSSDALSLGSAGGFRVEHEADRSHQDLMMLRQAKSVAAGIHEKLVSDAQAAKAAAEKAHLLHKACNKELSSLDKLLRKIDRDCKLVNDQQRGVAALYGLTSRPCSAESPGSPKGGDALAQYLRRCDERCDAK